MRYPGGKGKCFQQLINLMPPHRTYIESHLGGGAVLRHKRPAELSFGVDVDPRVIAHWTAQTIDTCHFVCADAITFLSDFPYDGEELVYVDPPYLSSTRRRLKVYRYEYSDSDHMRLLETLKQIPCKVMLSGYESEMYKDALPHWEKVAFSAKTHVGVREECVWMNFAPPHELHDATHIGKTFRDRQNIRRRATRLIERFDRMNPAERSRLLRTLNQRFDPPKATQ